jgi:hypothetical protein
MGLLIHKTSLFLAFVDKFLCKNEGLVGGSRRERGGGGDIMPLSMLNLFDIFPLLCDTDDGCISDALVRY